MGDSGEKVSYSIVVFGIAAVGKSALLIRFVHGYFEEEYDPTIASDYSKTIKLDNKSIMLKLLDTAGQDDIRSARDNYIKKGDGFIIVYAIDDEQSFEKIEEFYESIIQLKPNPCIVLCGNKADKTDDRKITQKEGQELADYMHASFLETSALTGQNLENAFIEISRKIRDEKEKNKPQTPPAKKSFFDRCELL
ncbi:small GTP-binding protein [Histomonas meleagridis]|uniref:small GTP-binding protein n=1 Tax=Histomonas meleagridis TaxID=135588 RepID=UPI00355966C6|nr:small GTP-binding protein [Histomonas meleagridis]KAH0798949.1 small GTP-binding protein [Histomonas meleagridis]